ncbi:MULTISPECIES: MerR family transcriptional regulator [Paenibacillus]|uniref:MerR family transcriptional regulator n=1 Tax=Paenibacillus borealis TaxID=160799 RepID=A0ABX3H165_PAEBO|nr:MerR family transcriptional regulator [Paenibacillus borealis]OMD43220.1 MerR family transcriptional regulator [Paenibacillus borealis]
MLYGVKETAALSKVTVKTLHHYHKTGLLMPCEISEAGYRLYGTEELERLQQILLYRELDLTLEQIKQLLEDEPDRLTILVEQEKLLLLRKQRLESMLETLKKSIMSRKKGEQMEDKELFTGFESEEEWAEAMKPQHEHLKETYDFELLGTAPVDLQRMNEMAAEAAAFMKAMAEALRSGVKHSDAAITQLIESHLGFLKGQGHLVSAQDFALQNRFFLGDDFHLQMLEGQQTGLAYYLSAAADYFAAQAQ